MKKNTQLRSAIRRNTLTNSSTSSSSNNVGTSKHLHVCRNRNNSWIERTERCFGIIKNTTTKIINKQRNGLISSNIRSCSIRSFLPLFTALMCCYAFVKEYSLLEKHYRRIAAVHMQNVQQQQQQNLQPTNSIKFAGNDESMTQMTIATATAKTTQSNGSGDQIQSTLKTKKIDVDIIDPGATSTATATSQYNKNNNNSFSDQFKGEKNSNGLSTKTYLRKEAVTESVSVPNDQINVETTKEIAAEVSRRDNVIGVDSSVIGNIAANNQRSTMTQMKVIGSTIHATTLDDVIVPKINLSDNKQQQIGMNIMLGHDSISSYLSQLGDYTNNMVLLQWDGTTGILIKTAPISDTKFLPKSSLHFFEHVQPSKYGTIALLLNTNNVINFPWDITPPVPILTYTIPKSKLTDINFIQVPNPFERDGWSRTLTWFAAKVTTPFAQRKNVIMWRDTDHHSIPNRIKLLEISQSDPNSMWLDAAIEDENKKMELYEMATYKYQLDIGDLAGSTWAGVRWKMCTGNVVFLVESSYQDWWYPTIEPYKHYIPVQNDLSDLKQQYDWAESHPKEVQEIIEQGQTICSYTSSIVKMKSFQQQTLMKLLPPASSEGLVLQATELLQDRQQNSFWKSIQQSNAFDSKNEEITPEEKLPEDVIPERTPVESELISIYATPSTSIARYLEAAAYPEMITLLKWNSSGILESISPIDIPDWLPTRAQKGFQYTKPSKYGTVAFLLNTDVLATVPWDYVPPIPFLTYTIPTRWNNKINTDFFLIPNPYDRDGYNRGCIEQAEKATLKTSLMERRNVLIWRGIPHGKSDPNRYKLFEMSKNDPAHTWLDAVNIEEEKSMYMTRTEMSQYRYQLDIGGESGTTWGSLRWKMCSGNLVFKVNSWSKDWWHETIRPMEHYIPVQEDLSDLRIQYDWAESHPDEVTKIVQQAIRTCMATATRDAVDIFQNGIIQKLPPASSESLIKEADAILYDKLGSYYTKVENRKLERN
jgi:Glycosyl transferase family 90